jgi:hypothetical protein
MSGHSLKLTGKSGFPVCCNNRPTLRPGSKNSGSHQIWKMNTVVLFVVRDKRFKDRVIMPGNWDLLQQNNFQAPSEALPRGAVPA